MSGVAVRTLLALVGSTLALAASAQATMVRSPLVMQADSRVAGFRTHESLGRAIDVFGRPASLHALPGYQRACDVSWPRIGLVMRFFAGGCTERAWFVRATATGDRWQTIRRLRIGDPVARLRSLYPGVQPTREKDGDLRWRLFQRELSTAGLTAISSHDRVNELIVSAAIFTVRLGG